MAYFIVGNKLDTRTLKDKSAIHSSIHKKTNYLINKPCNRIDRKNISFIKLF